MSAACNQLARQLVAVGIEHRREVRFWPSRRWRIDILVADSVAVEVDGGGWIMGRHSRGAGIEKDAEKSAHIAMAGYRLIRVTPKHVKSGEALQWIEAAILPQRGGAGAAIGSGKRRVGRDRRSERPQRELWETGRVT